MRRTAVALTVIAVATMWATAVGAESVVRPSPAPTGVPTSPTLGWRVGAEPCGDADALLAQRRSILGDLRPDGYVLPDDAASSSRQCELDLNPCAYLEQEPICYDGYIDEANGGCNSSPYAFETITPYYGTIYINGKSGVFDGGSTRDTDWYEIVLDQPTDLVFRCIAEFPLAMYIIDGDVGCGSVTILYQAFAEECEEGVIAEHLSPGTYWLFVASQVWDPAITCDSDYVITLEGFYDAPDCVTDCPFGAMLEGEPQCGPDYEDLYNGGCNFIPQAFQPIEPSGDIITICGEAGVYPFGGLCYRDLDWYELTLDEYREIEFCTIAAFEYMIMVFDVVDGCNDYNYVTEWTGAPCDVSCQAIALDPGTYWVVFATSDWTPLDCGRSYVVTIDGYTTPVEKSSWGSVKALYR